MPLWRQVELSVQIPVSEQKTVKNVSQNLCSMYLTCKPLFWYSKIWCSVTSYMLHFNCHFNSNWIYISPHIESANWVASWKIVFILLKCPRFKELNSNAEMNFFRWFMHGFMLKTRTYDIYLKPNCSIYQCLLPLDTSWKTASNNCTRAWTSNQWVTTLNYSSQQEIVAPHSLQRDNDLFPFIKKYG